MFWQTAGALMPDASPLVCAPSTAWSAAALPEIMAGALQESKLDVPVLFHEGRAAGLQPCSAAGVRGSGAAEVRASPNVELNGAENARNF